MTPQGLLVGAAAGLASALLFAGLVTQSVSAFGLSLAAPIPLLIASLGWGSVAGFGAAIASAVFHIARFAVAFPFHGRSPCSALALPLLLIRLQ